MTNIEPPRQAAILDIEQTLAQAVEHHRADRQEEAVALYQSILQADPRHAEANHNMGVMAVQVNQPAAGLSYFMAALDADPSRGQYWLSYVDALFQADQVETAHEVLALARQQGLHGEEVDALAMRLEDRTPVAEVATAEDPRASRESPPAPSAVPKTSQTKLKAKTAKPDRSTGKLAPHNGKSPGPKEIDSLVSLFNLGRFAEAATLAEAMTVRFPLHEFGWKALGAAFKQMGRTADALVPMQKAATLSPRDVETHFNLGVTLQELGRLDEAGTSYRRSLEINPDYVDALSNLGVIFQNQCRLNEAEASFRRALEIKPDNAKTLSNLGVALQDLGRMDEAETSFRRALLIKPDNPEAHNNLGNTLKGLGRPGEAEASYRRALQISPDYADAHNNLGIVLQDMGRLGEAEASYRRAIQFKPDYAAAYGSLGHALKDMGRLDEAEATLRLALQINPDFADAHCNLGATLEALGRLDEAEASYRRALEANPKFARAHSNLGIVLKDLGRLNEAEASYRKALEIEPDIVEARINLGNTLKELGRPDEAEASYREAIRISPNSAEAHYNLGISLHDRGRQVEAAASYRKALEIKPDYTEAHNNLAVAQKDVWQLDEAMASCRRALEINPEYVEAHNNLGTILRSAGRLAEAEASYRRALAIDPNYSKAHSNLSVVQKDLGRLDEAMASCHRALEIDPECTEAHLNLGNILQDLWQLDEAVARYRRALEIKPDFAAARSNLLFCLSHDETVDAQELFAEHCRFGEQFEARLRPNWPQHRNSRDPERCLQIGFVSADLCDHSVAYFIEPVLAHLAAYPQLSLHAFYNDAIEDLVTQRLRKHLKHWHAIAGLADEVVAQEVRDAGIDILIDLSGHTGGNRLLTFARKPAPIQASWMGYPGTSGMQAMDYYLADRFFLPNERFGEQFTEAFARLPASAPFLPYQEAPAVNTLPALSNGYMTFGSFNRASKISRSIVALWSKLLRALPNSRLLLAGMPAADKEGTLIEWFAQEGIERSRLSFHVRSDMDHYLALHHQVDICLDTFPYNGGTTTLHALWMGAPTLTLAGSTPASRSGASVLGHVGLETFVADDAEDFVRKGLSWVSNLAALQDIRAGLRERFAKSAMSQPELIAESLQRAFRIMWQRWCNGLPAESFEVIVQAQTMRPA
jgi:protein O-GlcNAc transferase